MKHAGSRGGVDQVWCLGDMVGYGPDPCECIRLLRELCVVCVAGNHDLAAAGSIDTFDFNANAAEAIAWTQRQLSGPDREYLASLPSTVERDDLTIVHGSPRDPIREYLSSTRAAADNLGGFHTPYCLVGHTHQPMAFVETGALRVAVLDLEDQTSLALADERLILNPGAVGQPRDGDPRASYATLDTRTRQFTLWRVSYDVEAVQSRMRQRGLPERLIDRLSAGV